MLLAALWGAPLIVLAVSVSGAKHDQHVSTAGASSTLATVGSRNVQDRRAVSITGVSGVAPIAFVDVPGTITSITVVAGETSLSTGAEVVSVDGHPLWALRGSSPLYRELHAGDSGEDVQALGRFLAARGLLDVGSADGSFGARYREAVQRFQHQAGYSDDGVFRPSYLIYIPQEFGAVTEVNLTVGQRITEQTRALRGTAPVVSLAVSPVSGNGLPRPTGRVEYGLHIGSERVTLSALPVSGQEIPRVWSAITAGITRGDLKSSAAEGDTGTQTQIEGAELEAGSPRAFGSVPAPSVFTMKNGNSCLFVAVAGKGGGKFRATPVVVSPDSGELGLALVGSELIGARVARDPTDLPFETLSRCK